MRTKKGFKLREVCGEKILLAEGVENIDFSDIISMNASSAYLWEQVDRSCGVGRCQGTGQPMVQMWYH